MGPKPDQTSGSEVVDQMVEKLFRQAKGQFGRAVKSYWFYDGVLCPACSRNEIDVMKIKGKDALSLNAFIHRPTGTLIGYFLCKACAARIFKDAQKNPYTQTEVHAAIERSLIGAFEQHLKKSKLS